MAIATRYTHSSVYSFPLPCTDENVEQLVRDVLKELDCTSNDVVSIQMDGPYGAGEWGVRVFCRKK